LSSEEKLAKQLDDIASSIIKALEGLERELSEYIKITNKRLHVLEDKMQNLESLADVSGKGLIKAFESSKPEEDSSFTQPRPSQPIESSPHYPTIPINIPPKITSSPPTATIPKIESEIPEPKPITEDSKLPPIPKPPTFQAEMEDFSSEIIPPTTIPEDPTIPDIKSDDKIKKKDSEDKDELMSALKIIDSL